jgi:hypothetical protein
MVQLNFGSALAFVEIAALAAAALIAVHLLA